MIKDDQLLEKYNKISEKVKNSIKKEVYVNLVYNEKHLKAKIKSYNVKIDTNFHNEKMPKEVSNSFLSIYLMYFFLEQIKNIILKCF